MGLGQWVGWSMSGPGKSEGQLRPPGRRGLRASRGWATPDRLQQSPRGQGLGAVVLSSLDDAEGCAAEGGHRLSVILLLVHFCPLCLYSLGRAC